jgi:hypothetical protein
MSCLMSRLAMQDRIKPASSALLPNCLVSGVLTSIELFPSGEQNDEAHAGSTHLTLCVIIRQSSDHELHRRMRLSNKVSPKHKTGK